MSQVQEKTANQMYKQYKANHGTLTFKEWVTREKKKGFLNATGDSTPPVNQPLNDSIASVVDQLHQEGGEQSTLNSDYILGIPKRTLIITGIVGVVLIVGVIIYKKKFAKQ